jgi:hypothetical protein
MLREISNSFKNGLAMRRLNLKENIKQLLMVLIKQVSEEN